MSLARITDNTKKKTLGLPVTTGKGELTGVRHLPAVFHKVDAYIRREKDVPTRPEANCRLVDLSLKNK